MQKKHQIFVSSTYSDLKLERQAAVESILLAGHIPAGMELFAAGDESQMEAIKNWIDDSDIYMLILGSRYGSINQSTGLSYTEHEYDYALAQGKPFFALVLSENTIDAKTKELGLNFRENDNPEKYNKFRERVLSKISKLVDDCKDIKIGVMQSIQLVEKKYSLHGWVRSDELPDMAPLVKQIAMLAEENTKLKDNLAAMPVNNLNDGQIQLAGLNDSVSITIKYKTRYDSQTFDKLVTLTWSEIFALIAPKLLSGQNDVYMPAYIADQIFEKIGQNSYTREILEQDYQSIKIHLMALNLISVDYLGTTKGGAALFWNLTSLGNKTLLEIRAARKP